MTLWNVEFFSVTDAFIKLNTEAPSTNQIAWKYKWRKRVQRNQNKLGKIKIP